MLPMQNFLIQICSFQLILPTGAGRKSQILWSDTEVDMISYNPVGARCCWGFFYLLHFNRLTGEADLL